MGSTPESAKQFLSRSGWKKASSPYRYHDKKNPVRSVSLAISSSRVVNKLDIHNTDQGRVHLDFYLHSVRNPSNNPDNPNLTLYLIAAQNNYRKP